MTRRRAKRGKRLQNKNKKQRDIKQEDTTNNYNMKLCNIKHLFKQRD